MGEPAHKLPEETAKNNIRPDLPGLRTLEGGGEGDGNPRGKLQSVAKAPEESDASNDAPNSSGGSSSVSPSNLALAGAAAGGLSGAGAALGSRLKGMLRHNKKQKLLGGGFLAGFVAVVFTISSVLSGPFELIHLGQLLSKPFSHSNNTSGVRTSALLRFSRNGDIGETRVGKLGSKVFANTTAQLKAAGIEFERNEITGSPKAATFDTEKLSKQYPELKSMTEAEKASFIEGKFGVPAGELTSTGGNKFSVNTRNYGIKTTRALVRSSVTALDDGKIVSGIKARAIGKFFNLPSLFHPLKRALAGKENTLASSFSERRAAEEERAKALEAAKTPETIAAEAKIKSNLGTAKTLAAGALLLVAGMCLVRSVVDAVVIINRADIVAPAAIKAVDKIATGSQVQTNHDSSLSAVGGIKDSLTDSKGNTVWQARAMSALIDPNNASGTDITPDYKQAFSKSSTAETIKDTIGGGEFGALACSKVGLIFQFTISMALIASAGLTAGSSLAVFAAKSAGGIAATAGVFLLLERGLTDLFKNSTIIPSILSGPEGGNIYAYGAREASKIEARASGGIPLSDAESNASAEAQHRNDVASFQSRPLFARMFDLRDYQSLASRIIDKQSPDPVQSVRTIVASFLTITQWLPRTLMAFSPGAHAASQPYDWGNPLVGTPDAITNDPKYEDPYDNGHRMAVLLTQADQNNDSSYKDRVKSCFGVTLSKGADGWNAIADSDVNPASEDYTTANCSEQGNENWTRLMVFVLDTRTMAAAACYLINDAQSCQEVGFNNGATAPATAAATTKPIIELDPGHSGTDISSIDPTTGLIDHDYPNTPEITEMFTLATDLKTKLEAAGYQVFLTKANVNDSVSLRQRADKASADKANLVISLHDDHSQSFGSFKQVYVQKVGLYRATASGQHIEFTDAALAAKSQQFGTIFQQERQKTEGGTVTIKDNSFDGRAGISPGNIALVQLLSTVPWVYNEVGGIGYNGAMYEQALLNSIEQSVPIVLPAAKVTP